MIDKTTKPLGTCPKCKEKVSPTLVEENSIRRDVCKCPTCEQVVLICRWPGCHDYAMGGEYYDDELCPKHTEEVMDIGKSLGKTTVTAIIAIMLKKKWK